MITEEIDVCVNFRVNKLFKMMFFSIKYKLKIQYFGIEKVKKNLIYRDYDK